MSRRDAPTLYHSVKPASDAVLAFLILLLLSPLLFLAAVLLLLETNGPVFYSQTRVGLNEKPFNLLKFRTMTVDEHRVEAQTLLDSDGVTRVGKLLRRYKIDELPQLFNVLKGDMSMVGPRPCLPSTVDEMPELARHRFFVKPGLTGLAQVNGNVALDWPERWKHDVKYVNNLSLLVDVKILLKTAGVVFLGKSGSRSMCSMQVLLVGSVDSSQRTLRKLLDHGLNVVAVFGYRPENKENISGYVDLEPDSQDASVPFVAFKNLNDHAVAIGSYEPDVMFVVGVSQLISEEIIALPKLGCVGFHPTPLPYGRGRAPLAWLILQQHSGAASFFNLGKGIDDGPVFVKQPFVVTERDDASSVNDKLLNALDEALDIWLPKLKQGQFSGTSQDEKMATYFAKRSPEDGLLLWHHSLDKLIRLIRATTRPHPGAFTYDGNRRINVWRAERFRDLDITGVAGRIVHVMDDKSFVVQCADGLIHVCEYTSPDQQWLPKVGVKLGYHAEIEIHRLRQRLERVEELLQSCNLNVGDSDRL